VLSDANVLELTPRAKIVCRMTALTKKIAKSRAMTGILAEAFAGKRRVGEALIDLGEANSRRNATGSTGTRDACSKHLHWGGAHGAPNWDPGIPNGTFDPMTVTAVKSFQTNIGISPADGVIREPTRSAFLS
jgi:hypothetical protein